MGKGVWGNGARSLIGCVGQDFLPCASYDMIKTIQHHGHEICDPLIQSGGGTGPMKPGNPILIRVPIPERHEPLEMRGMPG